MSNHFEFVAVDCGDGGEGDCFLREATASEETPGTTGVELRNSEAWRKIKKEHNTEFAPGCMSPREVKIEKSKPKSPYIRVRNNFDLYSSPLNVKKESINEHSNFTAHKETYQHPTLQTIKTEVNFRETDLALVDLDSTVKSEPNYDGSEDAVSDPLSCDEIKIEDFQSERDEFDSQESHDLPTCNKVKQELQFQAKNYSQYTVRQSQDSLQLEQEVKSDLDNNIEGPLKECRDQCKTDDGVKNGCKVFDYPRNETFYHSSLVPKRRYAQRTLFQSDIQECLFSCNICGKMYPERGLLEKHRMLHATNQNAFSKKQESADSNADNSLLYKEMVAQEHPYVCGECGKFFSRKSCLATHELTHKVKDGDEEDEEESDPEESEEVRTKRARVGPPQQCNICGKMFASQGFLNVHFSKAHCSRGELPACKNEVKVGERRKRGRPKKVPVQGNPTPTPDENKGMEVRQDHPFKCTPCGKVFAMRGYLTLHIKKVHLQGSRDKPKLQGEKVAPKQPVQQKRIPKGRRFSCDVCGKTFSGKATLVCHKTMHV